jgi:hypothetical protein
MQSKAVFNAMFSIVLLLALASAGQAGMVLVREGEGMCTIVTCGNPSPAARLAALELQSHILRMTGVEVPVQTEPEGATGLRILVGDSAAVRELGFDVGELGPQEYLIAFRPGAIVLLGRDWADTEENRREEGRTTTDETLDRLRHRIDYWQTVGYPDRSTGEIELPGLYDPQGTCYAVYDFLERFCGVRWYGPAAINQVVPVRASLEAGGADIRRAPALRHRGAMSRGSWPFLRGQWGEYNDAEVFLYWRRMRLGGERWAGNHTIHRQTIRDVFNDPAYQAQGRAEGMNLCYTNEKLVVAVAEQARAFFDGRGPLPPGFKAMGDYFALVPEDVGEFCRCDACRALLRQGREMRTEFFSSGTASNYWFSFVNAVARELRKTHPDKYIATLAYWQYAYPPRGFELEPNVSIAPCLHICYYAHDAETRENDMDLYRQWLGRTRAPMFLWVYHHHPMEPALINRWKCFPHVTIHETARAMRQFIGDGVRGIFQCGEQDQLEQYLMMKIWDDPALDAGEMIDEFFNLYFGAAAAPMKSFYLRLESIACDPANYPEGVRWPSEEISWQHLGTPERMGELGAFMAEARACASTPEEKRRVALWDEAIWQWMAEGHETWLAGETAPAP